VTRIESHRSLSRTLSAQTDHQLAQLLEGRDVRSSVGGGTTVIDVAGTPVFVKRIPLTALEAAHPRSTANLFELPLYYQYRIGSSGFGAWRELATHELTTRWVVDGACDAFPLLHHARVLPAAPVAPPVEETAFRGSPAIRARLDAIARASSSIVLFLEYLPVTVHAWFTGRDPAAACAWIERATQATLAFLRSHEVLHMDAHWNNLLTDGQRIYFSDFGLAIAKGFELSAEERAFFDRHVRYDEHVLRRELVYWAGELPDIRARHAEIAQTLGDFYQQLRVDPTTRYPDAL
jgi:hypothetical protein